MQTFKSSIKKICESSTSDLISWINWFLLSYRSILHNSASLALAELLSNWKINTDLNLSKPHTNKIKHEKERHLIPLKTAMETWIFYPGDLVLVRSFRQRKKQWLEGRIVKDLSFVIYIYLVQLKVHDIYCKKHVDQVRYQPIIGISKVPIQNKTDIIKN